MSPPAPGIDRSAIAAVLRETGDLLELQGENPFRSRAYSNGARAIEGLAEDPQELLEQGRLGEVRGIGPGLVGAIAEIVQTGRLSLHDSLKSIYSKGVLDLLRVPGLGPKRLRQLIAAFGVDSPAALERACRDGRVAALPGFGEKSAEKLLAGLARLEKFRERHLYPEARAVALELAAYLSAHPAVARLEIAGSLRRSRETIGDIDLLAEIPEGDRAGLVARFTTAPAVEEVIEQGATKAAVRLTDGYRADLRMVEAQEFAAALLHFTGSKEHNVELRGRAKERGWTLNEYGLFAGERRLGKTDSEAAIYRRLGLSYIPPEAREGLGEIALADGAELPRLVEWRDVRGALHVHTDWSDGIASLDAMAEAAAALGWEYLGIADHSRSAAYAGGLSVERVREQWQAIDAWNAAGRSPRLFKGTEVDILSDGSLDFSDELLLEFDFVVASVHSRFGLTGEAMTARLVRAVRHPCVTFLGHPTGRLLLMREPYALDLDAVLDAAADNQVVVELNSNPLRLDLDWRPLRGWLSRGCRTALNPDAHSPQGLADVGFGVGIARKALATPGQVINCLPVEEVGDFFRQRRERAKASLRQA